MHGGNLWKGRGQQRKIEFRMERRWGWLSGPWGFLCARIERVGSRFCFWCANLWKGWLRGMTGCGSWVLDVCYFR